MYQPNFAVPSSSPQNVTAVAISSNEIWVAWEEVPPIDQNGIIFTYEVFYYPWETFGGALMSEAINTSNKFIALDSLHPFMDYTILVRAFTSAGAGPVGTDIATTFENCKLITIVV